MFWQVSLVAQMVRNLSAMQVGDPSSIPGLERSPGEENVNPLLYSYMENSMDRETWRAPVHGATKSQTWLRDKSFPSFLIHLCNHHHHRDIEHECHLPKFLHDPFLTMPATSDLSPHWSAHCHCRLDLPFPDIDVYMGIMLFNWVTSDSKSELRNTGGKSSFCLQRLFS